MRQRAKDKDRTTMINKDENVQHVRWLNVYLPDLTLYDSKEKADRRASAGRVGVIKIVYENDEVVEHSYEKIGFGRE